MAKAAAAVAKPSGFGGFLAAPKVATPPPTSKKPKTVNYPMPNVKKIGALDWLITAAESVMELFMMDLKKAMVSKFITDGCALKSKPSNFMGEEDGSTASCQLRRRSSSSHLTEDEVERCTELKITLGEKTLTEERYIFNPILLNQYGPQIEEALKKIPGLPANIIEHQTERKVYVSTDDAIEAAFKLTPLKCLSVLPILTTLAVSPKFEIAGGKIDVVMNEVADIMNMPELTDLILSAKKKKKD